MSFRVESWRIQPVRLPRLWRRCSQCGISQPFICSERFRINANSKAIDVWLLYRCSACEDTWKLPIHSRRAITAIAPAALDAFERNDLETAHRYACDVASLRAHARVEVADDAMVVRTILRAAPEAAGDQVTLTVIGACGLRLDRLLARELGVSRSLLLAWVERDEISIAPHGAAALRRPACDGQILCFRRGLATLTPLTR